tara:strand:+ start:401 stop:1039 length:639 start_codon:yes stop_codon:yes gene_type:complete
MELFKVIPKNIVLENNNLSPCHLQEYDKTPQLKNKVITEDWLQRKIDDLDLKFRYFITLSFWKANKSVINQYLDNHHIKKVILDFFYPHRKPNDRIKLWFFVEKHKTGFLHLHILMEGMNGLTWMSKFNRKITLSKKTLYDIVSNDFSMDDVITEALTNHLKSYIYKLGKGKQSTDIRNIGEVNHRVQYLNKSLQTIEFDKWEHIDFKNSDL